jgi:hypothetical protein
VVEVLRQVPLRVKAVWVGRVAGRLGLSQTITAVAGFSGYETQYQNRTEARLRRHARQLGFDLAPAAERVPEEVDEPRIELLDEGVRIG